MRVKLIKDAPPWHVGTILPDVPDGQANVWIDRGIAVEEPEDRIPDWKKRDLGPHNVETADAAPPVKRKRGRPRKKKD